MGTTGVRQRMDIMHSDVVVVVMHGTLSHILSAVSAVKCMGLTGNF